MSREVEPMTYYGLGESLASSRVAAKRASQHEMVDHNKKRAAFEDITNATKDAARLDKVPGTSAIGGVPQGLGCEAPAPAAAGAAMARCAWWLAGGAEPVDFDREDERDACACASHASEIHANLRRSELRRRPSVCYMETVQAEVNPLMRGILVDWLVEVAQEYRLCSDTLFLSVALLDRYLSRTRVARPRLQLAGVAAALVAAKYEEIYAPAIDDFVYITDGTYTRAEVLESERNLLIALDHDLTQPTTKTFLRRAIRAAAAQLDVDATFEGLANYAAELSLLEYGMLAFLPSAVASACVLVALACLRAQPWTATLEAATGYVPRDLRAPAEAIHALLRAAKTSSLPAMCDKYSSRRHSCVAQLGIPDSLPDWLWA